MNESDDVPFAGTATSSAAADEAERASGEIRDLIGIEGRASDTGPGVSDCSDRDPEKFFRIFHAWSFTPASTAGLDGMMEHLEEELPKHGWKVAEYGRDTSMNKNLQLTADNDGKKHSVNIVHRAKQNPPKLSLMLVSGCYRVPEGEKVERF
ncbi:MULTISPECIES: hypothetical protein [Streptomyces]|uniref:Uncharacterized protein n=1 Tax=Streptomyces sudanensis TaxID=436397 RepID=A0ABY4TBL4_9ACTN|nr:MULTISPECIES: hypothetical protein [Streptomyces]MCP9957746.1 hypothetical protein [Streptomyces sudanensis]MCP9986863.1 hypothetical protein [Streptomyces sudanensis]MCQ0001713.1 hypothetical protein [Streptomyces sudanensis]URN15434.1 hypothetical protein MW084_05145 [Streptomyces sudanensis]